MRIVTVIERLFLDVETVSILKLRRKKYDKSPEDDSIRVHQKRLLRHYANERDMYTISARS